MDALRKIVALVRDPNVTADTTTFVLALVISLVVAFYLSLLYRVFYENRATGSQIQRSFILLGPAITAIFIAIQYSLPLSLGLLGALSIIRFRTPIKEPEEVGFIMLLTACSVVTATFQLLLLFALLVITTLGLTIKRFVPAMGASSRKDGIVLVSYSCREGGREKDAFSDIEKLLTSALPKAKLESVSQTDGVANVQFSFCDLSTETLSKLRSDLGRIDDFKAMNLYFNKTSSLL
jgi:hypothetical protein